MWRQIADVRRAWAYGGLIGGLLVLSVAAEASDWSAGPGRHAVMEAMAATAALLVGTLAMMRHYARPGKPCLLLATGLLAAGVLDGCNAAVAAGALGGFLSSPAVLSSWIWTASATLLGAAMFAMWADWRREQRLGGSGRISDRSVYVSVSILTAACILLLAVVPLPRAYHGGFLGRPQELIPATLFAAALAGHLARGAWRRDTFEDWVSIFLILGAASQALFMARSSAPFDTMFNLAHLLKLASYAAVQAAVLIDGVTTVARAERSAAESRSAYTALRAESSQEQALKLELREINAGLEQRVSERTKQLEDQAAELKRQRTAALNMMQDAREAQARAERNEQALARSNAELEQFAYVASHDLQEPLRMVASYLQLLDRRYGERLDGDAKEFMQYAVNGAMRMKQLINDLLAYSRVGSRAKPFEPCDCETVLEESLANLHAAIREKSANITHDPLPTIYGDATQLGQVFQNLIGNAIKFSGDGRPEVCISAAPHGDGWRFSVRDNGIGIDPQFQSRLFVIFQRLHTSAQYPGTGIGLAVCKKIVERHGGRIWFESEPGRGSTFHFTIMPVEESQSHERDAA